jgi:hypothetical protein
MIGLCTALPMNRPILCIQWLQQVVFTTTQGFDLRVASSMQACDPWWGSGRKGVKESKGKE